MGTTELMSKDGPSEQVGPGQEFENCSASLAEKQASMFAQPIEFGVEIQARIFVLPTTTA